MVSVADTQTLVPSPEYRQYEDQAKDLDENTARISNLTRALKRRGIYDQAVKELKRLATAGDNQFVPVPNYAELVAKGGLKNAFETEDITMIAVVLKELYVQRGQLIQGIYEITGIADIMRGASDPNETLGAQKLKAQFGSNRLKKRQRAVQKWIRDLYKLKAEIIAEHFEPQILQEMTGMQIDAQVMQLLRSDKLRSYRIDIETDSTVFEDAEAEKQGTTEMLTAVATFLEKAVPTVQATPALAPLAFEMLAVGVRSYKEGKKIEDVVEQTRTLLEQSAQQPKPPSPEQQKAQAEQQQQQMDMQAAQQKHQLEIQKMQAEMAAEQQAQRAELQFLYDKLGIQRQEMQMKLAASQQQAALAAERGEQEHEFGLETLVAKHEAGLEMMDAKAKAPKPLAN
jgi:hypothetical protein